MKKSKNLEWKPILKKPLFKTRVFEVFEVSSLSPDGVKKEFISLNAPQWIIVVPTIKIKGEEHFIMVEQWRHGSETLTAEFPGGVADLGETPLAAAKRELLEETGKQAEKIKLAASVFPNPAIMQNKCHIFLAECSANTQEQNLDEDEFLNCFTKPVNSVIEQMGQPPFDHALMCTALMLYMKDKLKTPN